MIEYFSQHPLEAAKYIGMIILAIIIWFLYRSVKTGDGKIFGNTKSENALKNEFKVLNEQTFSADTDDYRLIVGMCLHIQGEVEKEKVPNEAFKALPTVKKNVMTLGYLFEDSQASLSSFFRSNGEPILSASVEAVKNILGGKIAETVENEFNMFDESNEEVSVNRAEVERLDNEFSDLMKSDSDAIYKTVANYIRNNYNLFI